MAGVFARIPIGIPFTAAPCAQAGLFGFVRERRKEEKGERGGRPLSGKQGALLPTSYPHGSFWWLSWRGSNSPFSPTESYKLHFVAKRRLCLWICPNTFFLASFSHVSLCPTFFTQETEDGARRLVYVAPRNGDLPQEHKSFSSLSPSCLSVRWRGALIN